MRAWAKTIALTMAGWALAVSAAAATTTISSMTPQGEVADVRQVVVRFSQGAVAFGEPRLPDPVTLQCEGQVPDGSGRWSSDREWLYDFQAALPPGTRCRLSARAGWQPRDGPLSGRTDFTFHTGGPAVVSIQPYDGATIAEDQFFVLRLNGPALESSVPGSAWCEVEGIGERIGVRIVDGPARDEVLKARHVDDAARAALTLVLGCQRPLPADTPMRLVWGPGIAARVNPQLATSTAQHFRYQVRAAFNAEFSCERERASAPCVPVRPLTLRFSAPVARALAAQVRLKPPAPAEPVAPSFDRDDRSDSLEALTFAPPFAEDTTFTIELPAGLRDDAGRPLANAALYPLAVATGAAPPIAKFAAAPFGVLEQSDPVLPVTLRHVQGDLRPGDAAGQVRVLRPQTDAEILAWYSRLGRYHEHRLSAKELGLPPGEWFTTEDDTDARGRPIQRRVERQVGTREVSLLAREASASRLELPQLASGGDTRPFEVIGIPLPEPGYHVVEIESLRLGQALLDRRAPMFVRTGVLVTNLGVHFKLGRENSVVWVTTLDSARPVEGAQVNVSDCRGHLLWSGATDRAGLARIDRALGAEQHDCAFEYGLFVTARKTDAAGTVDTAFVFSNWQQGIEPWRFDLPTASGAEPDLRAATVFDRTLLRAGETVSMKHFVRRETRRGLAELTSDELPTQRKITHRGSGATFTQALQWGGVRSAASSWSIPRAARLGVYDVALVREDGGEPGSGREWPSGEFRVEEFRVPLVDARLDGPRGPVVAPETLEFAAQLNYFSGGGMARIAARVSAVLKERAVAFDGFDGFSFAAPRSAVAPLSSPGNGDADDEPLSSADTTKLIADKLPLTTDARGAATVLLKDLPRVPRPSQIDAELSFDDPNGEVATVATTVPVWPSALVLGIKTAAGWTNRDGKVALTALVLDTSGKPVAGQPVDVRARLSRVISTRKRMVGGFYAYDNRTEVQDLGAVCSGSSDARGLLVCEAELQHAGQVELIATATDAAGRAAQAGADVWVSARGELWFAQRNDDRIDVLPEKTSYEPGETAKLQVRMPFREATALVAIEREGVLDTRVVPLRGNDPNLEVRIEPDWGPNVYVSVLALRGRIRDVPWYSLFTWGWREPLDWARAVWSRATQGSEFRAPTALVDLARPAFRFGVARLKVGIGANRLQVAVTPDRTVYQTREKATVHVKVAFDGKPVAGATVAFAAVDEGLLALRANDSWDLLDAMIRERAWGVQTATAQSEIIGRRHYGRKAVAAGGGGGRGGTRELFDTLLLWRADVALDADGEATVEVPLNDSLTSFRLVAVADAGAQRFGTGSASIRVTQDLQLLGGLPPLLRGGDEFSALLTVRNTTARAMNVRTTLEASADGAALPALPPHDAVVAAGAATELAWTVRIPSGAASVVWEAAAREENAPPAAAASAATPSPKPAQDRLKVTQRIVPAVPERVLQATLEQLDGALTLPVAAPERALPPAGTKRGGITIAAQPRLSGALPGIRRFFERYPFTCLEQQTSKALGLGDPALWQKVIDTLPTYLDGDGLANYFPTRADAGPTGSDTLTAYLLAAAHDAGFELPKEARDTMLGGLKAFVEGRIERRVWAPAATPAGTQRAVRNLAAIAALARWSAATPRMLGSIDIAPNVWPTGALIDWLRILKTVPGIANQSRRLAEANQLLRSRLTYAGTTLRFSTEASDFWWWLMDSADANAARLILAVQDDPQWRQELPRMVVGALARQRGGAWLTTTANLWGALALTQFSARFESQAPTGGTIATLGADTRVFDWDEKPDGGSVTLRWPAQPATLDVTHLGGGKPWLTVQSVAAIALDAPVRAGYGVRRTVHAVEQKVPGRWSRGDVLRVRLEIEAQSDMTWVVVSDPVPGGATILGSGLGRDSAIAAAAGTDRGGDDDNNNNAWPTFQERGFEALRSYFDVLPRGRHTIDYTLRLNNPGTFALPPTRVEALYAPETFGETPNAALSVAP